MSATFTEAQILEALSTVADPEIGKPITELDMVKKVTIDGANVITEIYLTIAGCPLKDRIVRDVTAAVKEVPGVDQVEVVLDVMSEDQRQAMVQRLRAGRPSSDRSIDFWHAGSKTRAILVASGKGGVGKSSVTANLGVALAQLGFKVGIVDSDIYGFSIHRILGARGRPTLIEQDLALPLEAHGVKVMSMGFLVPDDQPVIWRGPMLHKVLQQFLANAYWGDVDFMLFDLPPGTGDVPLSIGQLLPPLPDGKLADMIVVTTPQEAAQKVAVRAGKMTEQVPMNVLGVIENMSYFVCPSCDEKHRIFGEGGGAELASALDTKVLGEIPIDVRLREGADEGKPIVLSDPESPASLAIIELAKHVAKLAPPLKGRALPLLTVRPAAQADPHAGHNH